MTTSVLENPPVQKVSVTGFCATGNHEGTKNFSERGTFLKPCRGTFYVQKIMYECTCTCHEAFRQIAALTGVRAAEASSEIIVGFLDASDVEESFTPTDVRVDGVSAAATPTTAAIANHGDMGPLTGSLMQPLLSNPAAMVGINPVRRTYMQPYGGNSKTFKSMPSGQRARGQLESEVASVVIKWFNGKLTTPIPVTPDAVRAGITSKPEPSNGAIYSIFQRWAKQGWVVLENKPFSIVGLVEHGARKISELS